MIIYKATNKINGMIYVGQTKTSLQRRINSHFGTKGRSYFANALRLHGLENFEFKIIDSSDDYEQINLKEEYWIMFFNCLSPNGYNLRTGGGTWFVTEEARDNMCLAATKRMNDKTITDKISATLTGRKLSEETKAKLSEALKGKRQNEKAKHNSSIAAISRYTRTPMSEETKEKLRIAGRNQAINNPPSLEAMIKMSEAAKKQHAKSNLA